ncbi:ABC transporter permease [Clostridia bacterium]|nr:ABC transporter permease [Clostridia bacterium]GHV37403.1 ABC transporter permease [Clostridia bacterium]
MVLKFRWGNIRTQKIIVGVTFMAIPLFLLLLFTVIPFFKMFEFSLFNMRYLGARTFVGLQNYFEVFTRKDIFSTFYLSIYYFVATFLQLALALTFATVLSFKLRGGGLFKGVIFFPFLVSGIAIGFIFKFFFTHGFVFDTVLGWFGLPLDSLPYWLRDTAVNNIALAGTSVWRYMGQNMVLFIGAIMSVDPNMYEAAEIDGANAWHKFWYIILPSIKSIVVLNLILSVSGSISVFEPPYVITNGTFGTSTFFLTMHKLAHENNKVGLAAAMAIVLLAIIVLVTVFQKVFFRIFIDEGKDGMTWSERRATKKRARQNGEVAR